MTSQWRHRNKTHSWYSELSSPQNVYFGSFILGKLSKWCCFVTYLSNNPPTIYRLQWESKCHRIHTIHIDAFINMLYTIMCTKYNRIQVELRACTKWTVHVRCGMFRTISVSAPYRIIIVFWAFHSYTGMCLKTNTVSLSIIIIRAWLNTGRKNA